LRNRINLPKLCWRFVDILPQLPKPILNKGEITQTKLNWKPARRDRKNALVSTGCTAEPEKRLFVFAFVVLNLTPFFPQLTFYFAFSIATPVHIFFLSPLNVFTRQKYFFHTNLAFSACVRLFATRFRFSIFYAFLFLDCLRLDFFYIFV